MTADRLGMPIAMTEEKQDHEHDWQVVNHDENRDIYKCAACGELKRE